MKNKIIQFLKESKGYISGEEMSRRLKISRSAIWKHIEELRKDGYGISAVKPLGYCLDSFPDKLFPEEIQNGLKSRFIGKKIYYYDSVDSTMDIAFRLGLEKALEGSVVCAEVQKKGKGRLDRAWDSPKGKGIYMSIILRPKLSLMDTAKLTLLSAVAVCEAIRKMTGVLVNIKWPNDILFENKKMAGILTELNAETDSVKFIVIGMGINVNTSLKVLPENATSLKQEAGKKISRVQLMQEILYYLEQWYENMQSNGFTPMMEQWKKWSCTLGRQVSLSNAGGDIEGEALDIDEYGGLVIRTKQGDLVKRMSGDVVIL